MTKVTIIVPVKDYKEAESYYRDVLAFKEENGIFFLPIETENVSLKIMIIDEKAESHFAYRFRFPIFSYEIERNFLSYCARLYRRGAMFEAAGSHPGGYYAYVNDPAGNQFEIVCDSFDENEEVDLDQLPFFSDC